jgi:predicted MPP superfamily phosphohydrolase
MPFFFILMVLIVAAIHTYIGFRLIPAPRFGSRRKKMLWGLIGLSAVSIPLTFVGGRFLDPGLASTALAWIGFTALGVMGIVAGLVVVRDLFLGGARLAPHGADPSRREFLRRASSFGVLGVGGVIAVEGFVSAARPPAVERVRVPIDDLPEALEGFRIAQISDTHLGPTLGRDFLADVVRRVNDLEPDVIAFTGDLADGYTVHMRPVVEPLRDLRARHGAYFVTGNHEYYWSHEDWIGLVRELGLNVLTNEHRVVSVKGAKLAVGGVPDARESERFEERASDPEQAFAGADDVDVKVLLAHRPKSLYGAQRAGAHLQLCGHTHGGQIFPANLLVYLAHPVVAGLKRFGDTWVYVNRGTAYWGPPMRTGGAGEITLVELARA